MAKTEIEIIKSLEKVLLDIVDAKERTKVTTKNKKIALLDICKLLNMMYTNICEQKKQDANKIFILYNLYWTEVIKRINKKAKFPLIQLDKHIWEMYLMTIFKSADRIELFEKITNWKMIDIMKKPTTPDMKIIMLSIIESFKTNNK